MKKKLKKQKTRSIYELIRTMGDGLSRQYDELATVKRVEPKF